LDALTTLNNLKARRKSLKEEKDEDSEEGSETDGDNAHPPLREITNVSDSSSSSSFTTSTSPSTSQPQSAPISASVFDPSSTPSAPSYVTPFRHAIAGSKSRVTAQQKMKEFKARLAVDSHNVVAVAQRREERIEEPLE
jgi:hypothetical protein